jgi:hypothetical protein
MSQGATALSEGFSALLDTNGETLTFRSAELRAVVNRDPFDKRPQGNVPDFKPHDNSAVEFLSAAVGAPPAAGEHFVDEFGHKHRIQSVKRLGNVTRCNCEVSG